MELIRFKKEKQLYEEHRQRVNSMSPVTHTRMPPETLTLTHLASRAKKAQLGEDRKMTIATENRKLMENMTKVRIYSIVNTVVLSFILFLDSQ